MARFSSFTSGGGRTRGACAPTARCARTQPPPSAVGATTGASRDVAAAVATEPWEVTLCPQPCLWTAACALLLQKAVVAYWHGPGTCWVWLPLTNMAAPAPPHADVFRNTLGQAGGALDPPHPLTLAAAPHNPTYPGCARH